MPTKDTKSQGTAERSALAGQDAAVDATMKALAKLVNGRKIYAANNPRLEQFRQEFETALRRFFEFEDELVLGVDQFEMRWNDRVVYENVRREESLAFILFKDGIGELTVLPKAVGAETDTLIGILSDQLHNLAGDDDIVTRFWNSDFEHIRYRVLDDYLVNEFGAGKTGSEGGGQSDETSDHPELLPSLEDKGRVIIQHADSLVSIDTMLREMVARHYHDADEREKEAQYQRMLRASFTIPAEEIALYTAEFERERDEDGVVAFVEAIFVFMLFTDNPSGVRDVASIIERFVEFAVSERNPPTLQRLTHLIREFESRDDLPDAVRAFCAKVRAQVASPALAASFLDQLTAADAHADVILAFAAEVGPGIADALVRTLHRLEAGPLHRRICDTLMAVARERTPAVLERFDVDHPEVALDAVYIARTIGVPALSPRLRQLAFYPDPRVKLEMLSWVIERTDADSTEILLASLNDPDKRVRLKVLDALVERPQPRVREVLAEIAFGKDLAERAPDEQDTIFRALGHVGDASTVAQLRTLVERRKLGLGKGTEPKLLALRALEKIRDSAALELVARLAEDPSEAVRLRAQRTKETLAASLASPASPKGAKQS
jgi:HEAT repeat protein